MLIYTSSTQHTGKLITAFKEVALFPSSLLQEGSSVEVLKLDGLRRIWIVGILNCLSGAKALVVFPETDGNGKRDEWVEMDPQYDDTSGPSLLNDNVDDQENFIPKIRPSMNVGNLPQQISLCNCNGVEEILKIGGIVETWTNDRTTSNYSDESRLRFGRMTQMVTAPKNWPSSLCISKNPGLA